MIYWIQRNEAGRQAGLGEPRIECNREFYSIHIGIWRMESLYDDVNVHTVQ